MKDQPSTSDDKSEPPRPWNLPEDFIWDPEIQAWYPSGEPSTYDAEAWLRDFREEMSNLSEEERHAGLITADELRAAGVLNVPASWRKSLGGGRDAQRDLYSDLDDDDSVSAEQ